MFPVLQGVYFYALRYFCQNYLRFAADENHCKLSPVLQAFDNTKRLCKYFVEHCAVEVVAMVFSLELSPMQFSWTIEFSTIICHFTDLTG